MPRGGRREGAGVKPGTTKGRPAMPGSGRPVKRFTLKLGDVVLVGPSPLRKATVTEVSRTIMVLDTGGGDKIIIGR